MGYCKQPASLEEKLSLYRIQPNGCWLWIGRINKDGYGLITIGSRRDDSKAQALAHRAMFAMKVQSIKGGQQVLHRCDSPGCVNPEHLFLGTQADNVADMVAKQRQQRGSRNGHAKLTEQNVRVIRKLLVGGVSKPEIGRRFGVDRSVISMISSGKRWRHV